MNKTISFSIGEKIRSLFALLVLSVFFLVAGLLIIIFNAITIGKFNNQIIRNVGGLGGRIAFFLMGIQCEVIYHSPLPESACVFIFNHTSTLDIPTTLFIRLKRVRFVAKYELLYNPFLGIIGLATGQVFINRGTSEKAVKSLQKAYQHIREKKLNLVIAPEGTRSHKERIGIFKKGAFHTAKDLSYPIVPMYYENTYHLSPGSSSFFKKGKVKIHIHEAISTEDWTNENLDENITNIRSKYLAWLKEYDGETQTN